MTVATTTARVQYSGNGVTTAFAIPFYFLANADIVVIVTTAGVDATKVLGTDYTLTGAGAGAGGTCNFVAAPANGTTITIYRSVVYTQPTDFQPAGSLPADTLEMTIDRLEMQVQQVFETIGRAYYVPTSDVSPVTALSNAAARASKYFAWDASGNPTYASAPTIDSSVLMVVSSSAPSHVNGRIWIDTGTVNHLLAKQSDGVDWTQIWDYNTSTNTVAVSIANDQITNAMLANMATATFKGRTTAGTGDPEDLTQAQATALINAMVGDSGAGGTKGLAPAPGAGDAAALKYLKADGTWAAIPTQTQPYAKYSHTVSSGTGGGNTVATTWTTRAINTEDSDASSIGSLASNEITLAAGNYRISAKAAFYAGAANATTKLRLRNITDGTTALVGMQAGIIPSTNSSQFVALDGIFTLSGAKALALQYYSSAANTGGLGIAMTTGENEIYCVVEIWKLP